MKSGKLNYLLTLFISLILTSTLYAQVPQNFNYQGVLRDSNGEIRANENVDIRFSILNNGTAVFSETHSGISTNALGLLNLKIGTVNTTDFSNIDWSSGTKDLQVEVDAGNGFENLGSSNLVSVPYALRAGTAASADISLEELNNVSSSVATSGDYLQWNGTDWVPATGAGGGTPSGPAGGDLMGTYPDPDIGSSVIETSNIADDAITADKLDQMGASSGDVLQWNGTDWITTAAPGGSNWTQSGNDLYYNNGYVGIGTTSPLYNLDISSGTETAVQVTSSSTNDDMTLEVENTSGTGLGVSVGSTFGVGFPGIPTGVYVKADDGYQGVYSSTTDEVALKGQTNNGGDAVEGYAIAGNGRSGYFHGGSGVLIEDGLETDDIDITGNLLTNGSSGSSDDILTSNGSSIEWTAPSNILQWEESGSDIYYDGGDVGIGDNASSKLHLTGNESGTSIGTIPFDNPDANLVIQNDNKTDGTYTSLTFATRISNNGVQATSRIVGQQTNHTSGSTEGNLIFFTSGENSSGTNSFYERMRIDENGNVGIGTNTPSHTLHVEGGKTMIGQTGGAIAKLTVNSTDTGEEVFRARKNGATQFIINEDGNVGVSTGLPDNEFSVDGTQNITGNLGIGTDSPDERLHVKQASINKAIRMEHETDTDYWEIGIGTNTKNFKFYYNGNSRADIDETDGSYSALSDASVKKSIKTMDPVIGKVMKMNPSTYIFKHDENNQEKIGFISQEIEPLFPQLVSESDNGLKLLNYSNISVIAIKAIQEQQKIIEEQNKINAQQQKAIDELRAELQGIKEKIKN